jgi:hypothetical protein
MVKVLRGAGQPQMRAPIGLATAHAYALPASIAFEYPFATLRSGPYWHAMRRDLGCLLPLPVLTGGGDKHQTASFSASRTRLRFLRSLGSSQRFLSRIDLGVISTSSSSVM